MPRTCRRGDAPLSFSPTWGLRAPLRRERHREIAMDNDEIDSAGAAAGTGRATAVQFCLACGVQLPRSSAAGVDPTGRQETRLPPAEWQTV
jgi:hypothetical protein